MRNQKCREEFIANIARYVPDASASYALHGARLLLRNATTLQRLSEESCNGHPMQSSPTAPVEMLNRLQTKWDARIEKQVLSTANRVLKIAEQLGVSVEFQGDPRGCPLYVVIGDRRIAVPA